MNTNVLITGTRAPAGLHLARLFSQSGCTVYAAESSTKHLCSTSRCVKQSFTIPPPRQQPEEFIWEINAIIKAKQIDLLIPICEEIYTLAKFRHQLACPIFCDSFEILIRLHDKWNFIQKAKALGLPVPLTWKVESLSEIDRFRGNYILKPVFSRFATEIYTLFDAPPLIEISSTRPWVVQEYLNGPSFCTYSIAHHGSLRAHAVYPVKYKAGNGACIYFESVEHNGINEWVEQFIKKTGFHGQIAFDFIVGKDGNAYPIECNPRATSGIHLFSHDLTSAFLTGEKMIIPNTKKRMLGLAMLSYGLPKSLMHMKSWISTVKEAKDVIWDKNDPLPFFTQFAAFFMIWKLSLKTNKTLLEASTYDIECNGE